MDNDITIRYVSSDPRYSIVVDLRTDTPPDYDVYGRTLCDRCMRSCHLSEAATDAVLQGATPICGECGLA